MDNNPIHSEVSEALEHCALLCDEQAAEWDSNAVVPDKNYAAHCAKLIRALATLQAHGKKSTGDEE